MVYPQLEITDLLTFVVEQLYLRIYIFHVVCLTCLFLLINNNEYTTLELNNSTIIVKWYKTGFIFVHLLL